jgi:trk/ktr system potassium uptake protein
MALRVFILGGGRFGTHLATRLCGFGCEVIMADSDPKRVEDLVEEGFHAVEMDADDETALKAAGVQEADAVVVAIGENMEASVLATLLLKDLKVKRLIARAVDVKHAQVLEKLGADRVVLPSRDMAYLLAESLRVGLRSDRVPINAEYQLARVQIGNPLAGRSLLAARLHETYGITVVLISREKPSAKPDEEPRGEDRKQDFDPNPDFVLQPGDWLAVTGRRARIDKFERDCGERH